MFHGLTEEDRCSPAAIASMWRIIRDEIVSIRTGPAPNVPVPVAAVATAAAVVVGNAAVLLQRRLGGDAGEVATTAVLPLVGAGGAAALLVAGWRREDVGLRIPSARELGRSRLAAPVAAGALGTVAIAASVRRSTHGGVSDRVTIVRLIFGTALGEELIHRGVLFGLWSATGASDRTVVLANATAFGAWHVMAVAPARWPLRLAGTVAPAAVGTAVFLWGRCRSRSMLGSALLHLAASLPLVVARVCLGRASLPAVRNHVGTDRGSGGLVRRDRSVKNLTA